MPLTPCSISVAVLGDSTSIKSGSILLDDSTSGDMWIPFGWVEGVGPPSSGDSDLNLVSAIGGSNCRLLCLWGPGQTLL
eukprot:7152310-Heterocapsa_arctica.AAC.1